MNGDAKQTRLRALFEELRRLKQEEVTFWLPDEFARVYKRARAREKIAEIERQIEEEMRDG